MFKVGNRVTIDDLTGKSFEIICKNATIPVTYVVESAGSGVKYTLPEQFIIDHMFVDKKPEPSPFAKSIQKQPESLEDINKKLREKEKQEKDKQMDFFFNGRDKYWGTDL